MGTTSAKVSSRFEFLATFPYSNPTRNDIKKLNRHINKALCRIKCLNLSKDKVKMLLKDGFDSSKLIEWGNELIDSIITHRIMEGCIRLANLIKFVANKIDYLEPLPILQKKYMNALSTDPQSAIKYVRIIAIVFVFLYIHTLIINQSGVENSDIEIAEKMSTDPYLERFFAYIVPSESMQPLDTDFPVVMSFGIINEGNKSEHQDFTGIGQYKIVDKVKYTYLPVLLKFGDALNCYYSPNTGIIRYLPEKFGDFKPITEHPSVGNTQPWVNLPDTYPFARKKDDANGYLYSTPFSYIDLNLLKDIYDRMEDIGVIQLPPSLKGFRLTYTNKTNDDNQMDFYSANINEQFASVNQDGTFTWKIDIRLPIKPITPTIP